MSDSAPISSSAAIGRDNPWPGLATFTEDQRAYFHGRDEEILDLTQLAERRPPHQLVSVRSFVKRTWTERIRLRSCRTPAGAWIFADEKSKVAFESCLFEACERSAWLLKEFVVMSNRYANPSRGWAIGGQEFKAALIDEHAIPPECLGEAGHRKAGVNVQMRSSRRQGRKSGLRARGLGVAFAP